jgi:translation initiation factor 4A
MVMDEADEMLSRGFEDQVRGILDYLPNEAQVTLFSATMPQEVLEITKMFMRKPVRILVKQEDLTLEGIKQFYVLLEKKPHKIDCLLDLFGVISVTQSIIYVNTKRMAEQLHQILTEEQFSVGLITGNMVQDDRNRVMSEFRNGKTRVLLATDMLARGIDVQQVSLVLNYDIPRDKETYIHRIGRSGRFGRKGTAINLVTPDEKEAMEEIEQFYDTQIEELPGNIAELL